MSKNILENERSEVSPAKLKKWGFRGDLLLIAIILPLIALSVELYTGICSLVFVNPIPTLWHVLLVGFVPIANTYLFWCLSKERYERAILFGWASAISAGISVFYSILFLPVSPISLFGIIVYGIGLLGLSPMFALWGTLLLRKHFRRVTTSDSFIFSWRGTLVGFLIAFAVIAMSESRFLITKHGLEMASSENAERQEKGLDLLRNFGNKDYLLRLSENNRGGVFGSDTLYISDFVYQLFAGSGHSSNEKVNEVFYRLNGKTVDEVGKPTRFGFGEREINRWQDREISLFSSEIEGSIDNDASLGYIEWIFELQNNAEFGQGEAIGQIQLPPDSVVSRLTLWVNGEEREAAYAERNRVSQAYENVVSSKRDPVLVTTAGKDRVDMKCFPVMPNGGKMKVKIGITFPLSLKSKKSGLLHLPYFRGKNFNISDDFKHKISILATNELESIDKNLVAKNEDRFIVMRGDVTNKNIEQAKSSIRVVRKNENTSVWAKYDNSFIKQEIIEQTADKPTRYIFVIDTSVAMKDEKESLISAIQSLPNETEVGLVITHGNALNRTVSYPNSFVGKPAEILEKVKQLEFGGGVDNLPALTKAWDLAKEVDNGVVIWIHAPQPFTFANSEQLAKKLIRRSNQTEIYNIPISNGFDEVEKTLVDLNFVKNVPRLGDLQTDLNKLISQLNQSTRSLKYARTIDTQAKETVDTKTSKHMIRLWAFDEINEILASEKDEKSAVELATKYQLVTPVTGAVVLETQEQYDQAGLSPVKKNVVHAVPEQQTYVLMIIGLLMIFWLVRKQLRF